MFLALVDYLPINCSYDYYTAVIITLNETTWKIGMRDHLQSKLFRSVSKG